MSITQSLLNRRRRYRSGFIGLDLFVSMTVATIIVMAVSKYVVPRLQELRSANALHATTRPSTRPSTQPAIPDLAAIGAARAGLTLLRAPSTIDEVKAVAAPALETDPAPADSQASAPAVPSQAPLQPAANPAQSDRPVPDAPAPEDPMPPAPAPTGNEIQPDADPVSPPDTDAPAGDFLSEILQAIFDLF